MVKAINNIRLHTAIPFLLLALICLPVSAQEEDFRIIEADTIQFDSIWTDHSPMKAAMYSAALPGLGQIYNRKYWKLPLVYAGLGGFGYAAVWNSQQYTYYFDTYKYMIDNGLQEYEGATLQEVEWYKDSHLRYKNLMIIVTIGFYVIQIVDASVDAHLIDYDISDDISLTVDPVMLEPAIINVSPNGLSSGMSSFGLRCCLSF